MGHHPNWTRDELILALDLYFDVDPSHTSEQNPAIVALSALLKVLPIHDPLAVAANFRSPDSVYMKLCNFRRLDGWTGVLCAPVWEDISGCGGAWNE